MSKSRVKKIERAIGRIRQIGSQELLPIPDLVDYLRGLSEIDLERIGEGKEPMNGPSMREWFRDRGYSFE